MESRNNESDNATWGAKNRERYDRKSYEDAELMGQYKQGKIAANGPRVNMEDEYLMTRNISASKAKADKRRNDPKHKYNAETDHVVPLKTIYEQFQNNIGLTDPDIRRIANQDYNFAVTSNRVNNSKRDMTNSEYIKRQDELKAQGKPYVELSPEQRTQMIRMEKEAASHIENEVNKTVAMNIIAFGEVERNELKEAIKAKRIELGRSLTQQEKDILEKKLSLEKTKDLHYANTSNAGKQSLLYVMGNYVLLLLKPLYYEMKDIFQNGMLKGVGVHSFKEALRIRFSRVKNYVVSNVCSMGSIKGSIGDFLKGFLSALIEGFIGMFVGIWKHIFKVLKEGIKICCKAYKVCFGPDSKNSTPAEKGDAIVKIVAAGLAGLCGIGIDLLLQRIPGLNEDLRMVLSTLLSGLASLGMFYVLDKADLFNVKKDKREQRIREIFEMRIQDIRDRTSMLNEAVTLHVRNTYLQHRSILDHISEASKIEDYRQMNRWLEKYQTFLAPETLGQTKNWNC